MNDERVRALRRQQALGVLGQMGGKNVGQFGQALYTGATQQMDDMREQEAAQAAAQQQGLDNTLKMLDMQQKMRPKFSIQADPVHGGIIGVDPYTLDAERITAPGEVGYGGTMSGEENIHGLKPGVGKPSSEEQRTGYNLGRILRSMQDLEWVSDKAGTDVLKPGVIEKTLRDSGYNGLAQYFSEDTRQVAHAAWADAIDALMWLSTGAAYNDQQLKTVAQAQIPDWNDSPLLLEFKMNRLVGSILDAAGRTGKALTQKHIDAINQVTQRLYGQPGMQGFDPKTQARLKAEGGGAGGNRPKVISVRPAR